MDFASFIDHIVGNPPTDKPFIVVTKQHKGMAKFIVSALELHGLVAITRPINMVDSVTEVKQLIELAPADSVKIFVCTEKSYEAEWFAGFKNECQLVYDVDLITLDKAAEIVTNSKKKLAILLYTDGSRQHQISHFLNLINMSNINSIQINDVNDMSEHSLGKVIFSAMAACTTIVIRTMSRADIIDAKYSRNAKDMHIDYMCHTLVVI